MINDKFILAGIDGAESWEYENPHVDNFYDDFGNQGYKVYRSGPELSGMNVTSICNEVTNDVIRAANEIGHDVTICLVGIAAGVDCNQHCQDANMAQP